MSFIEFLKLCQTVRTLYSKEVAQQLFEHNVAQYYNLGEFNLKKDLPNS